MIDLTKNISIDEADRTGPWTATELLAMDFPEPKFIVPGFITEGVTLIGGKPKIGKSWMMLGMAIAVANGGKALDKVDCTSGDVLYLALEDSPRRLRMRLKKLLSGNPEPPMLVLTCDWPRLDEGGLDRLREWLDERPSMRMVIVDTLAMVRGRISDGDDRYASDYGAIAGLHKLARAAAKSSRTRNRMPCACPAGGKEKPRRSGAKLWTIDNAPS